MGAAYACQAVSNALHSAGDMDINGFGLIQSAHPAGFHMFELMDSSAHAGVHWV